MSLLEELAKGIQKDLKHLLYLADKLNEGILENTKFLEIGMYTLLIFVSVQIVSILYFCYKRNKGEKGGKKKGIKYYWPARTLAEITNEHNSTYTYYCNRNADAC